MTIRVAIEHRTTYTFDRAVGLGPHVVRLRPAPHCRTPIRGYSLVVRPEDHFVNWQQDPFGNFLARYVFHDKSKVLDVDVEVIADMAPINPFDFFLESYAVDFPFRYEADEERQLEPYLHLVPGGPRFDALVAGIDRTPRSTNDALVEINSAVKDEVDYTIRMEPGVLTPEQTLERGIGSCRDSGWLLVQAMRHLGLAARFVSGYLVQLKADEKPVDGPAGPEADFTDLHAWCEVYLPGAGWVGLDPTSGLLAAEGHIPLAATPTPIGAAPITGATEPCAVELSFTNTVRRVDDPPRSTLPYRPDQRDRILALGRRIDADLVAGDVRLTTGGEPTFVSIDDVEGEEWHTAADGARKRALAEQLVMALRDRFAPGGFLHVGQGKWYPGEPLPRWARRVYWRRDGTPLWERDDLVAGPEASGDDAATAGDTGKFADELARRLGLSGSAVMPAYEDPLHAIWQEQRLPPGVDPADADPERADLDDLGHRADLARILQRGLTTPAGQVLPLNWDGVTWESGPWPTRRDRIFLLPGSSPMGLRLPLDSLPAGGPVREPAPVPDPLVPGRGRRTPLTPQVEWTDEAGVRTALCVEARDGVLYVFLPPVEESDAYFDLVRAVHDTAAALDRPVRVEGYEPPRDPAIAQLAVTPDPGVIEVNVHPAHSWDQTVEITTEVYRIAKECRLTAEKFDLDGRHAGTGGGNHVTIGGPTPADSPLLRRPDLLASLLLYWQHHPSLSYLFSGNFIGPTSQAPRIDEARVETLDELELAFEQLDAQGPSPAPWLVDRILRNLLVDMTGNTHRSEFCIDKLYAPGSASGRLGLLELRAFEMPPHADMSLVQQLLLRALIARFWAEPYRGRPVRWGTRLHDQFLLPHYVAKDIAEVCRETTEAGYELPHEWMIPFVEFRFPFLGSVEVDGVTMELRRAVEPWPVLGEELTSMGTARGVDSSVERVEVEVIGAVPGRHAVLCNGTPLALHPAGADGRFVGGVRFLAWELPFSLHPTVPLQNPLVFDLVDTWNQESLGGFRYHVSHPGGRAYDRAAVNANEASGRRLSRFWEFGHTPTRDLHPDVDRGSTFVPVGSPPGPLRRPVGRPADVGFTLDLRRESTRAR